MEFKTSGTKIYAVVHGVQQELSTADATRLLVELSTALQEALEERHRAVAGRLVAPGDAAWEAAVANLDLDARPEPLGGTILGVDEGLASV